MEHVSLPKSTPVQGLHHSLARSLSLTVTIGLTSSHARLPVTHYMTRSHGRHITVQCYGKGTSHENCPGYVTTAPQKSRTSSVPGHSRVSHVTHSLTHPAFSSSPPIVTSHTQRITDNNTTTSVCHAVPSDFVDHSFHP